MAESRCGLLCSECKWKAIMKCDGCFAIKKPFWGPKCPIKKLLRGKRQGSLRTVRPFSLQTAA